MVWASGFFVGEKEQNNRTLSPVVYGRYLFDDFKVTSIYSSFHP